MAKAMSKAKNISAGVGAKGKKAPMVDPKGAWTKIQERTLGNMKKGGKVSKKK
jgi:multidrug resistance efflux pump